MKVYTLSYGDPDSYEGRESLVNVFTTREGAMAQIVADALNGTGPTGATIGEHEVVGEVPQAYPVNEVQDAARDLRLAMASAFDVDPDATWDALYALARRTRDQSRDADARLARERRANIEALSRHLLWEDSRVAWVDALPAVRERVRKQARNILATGASDPVEDEG